MFLIIASLIILLSFSFLFSGTETAFFSLSDIEIKRIIRKERGLSGIYREFSRNKTEFLMVLLLCNTFVNVSFIAIANLLFEKTGADFPFSEYFEVLIVTYVLLAAGEITPKILAVYRKGIFIQLSKAVYYIYLPLKSIVHIVLIPFRRITGGSSSSIPESEFMDILTHLKDNEHKLMNEIELLEKYYLLKKMECREIAVPASRVVHTDRNASASSLYSVFESHRFSRIPVLDESGKTFLGIVLFRDLVYLDDKSSVKSIVRKTKSFDYRTSAVKMLAYFFSERIHIAALQDHSGKFFGIITLTDIIEKLTGPLPDERRIA